PLPLLFTLFPYTTLFRSLHLVRKRPALHEEHALVRDHDTELPDPERDEVGHGVEPWAGSGLGRRQIGVDLLARSELRLHEVDHLDRKSTRLNSSHGSISY